MRRLFMLSLLSLLLSSCSLFHLHRVEIVQGNVMNKASVDKLHVGMSEGQVEAIMGPPILVNILHNGRVNYIYTTQLGTGDRIEKRVELSFRNNRLQTIERSGI